MRLDIDKTGRDGQTGNIDVAARGTAHLADGGDAAVGNGEIANFSGASATVVERAATQREIKGHGLGAFRTERS